jgi:uncharacterized protein YbjT (DUF2867 family)
MRIVIAGATGNVGKHVHAEALRRGHDVVALSRKNGQDVSTGEGLAAAMAGAQVVIDVSNQMIMKTNKAVAFFTTATRNLQAAEHAAGVGHHIALSIVGIDELDTGYNAGKLAQERLVTEGDIPWTLQRATQFHEFAGQALQQGSIGPVAMVPKMLLRPIAAREVAARLLDLAEAAPAGRVTDLVGPRNETLIDMVRRTFTHDGTTRRPISVRLPGKYWKAAASGQLRGTADHIEGRQTFDQWLDDPANSEGKPA